MKKIRSTHKTVRFFKYLYLKTIRLNDKPHNIALGWGLGVFTGIMPGMGLVAAFFLAFLLRVNRAATLLGSLLTNTWLSFLTFMLSIKVGSVIMGRVPDEALAHCKEIIRHFHWKDLFETSVIDVLLPMIIGYIALSIAAGFVVYALARIILEIYYVRKKARL